MHPIHMQKCRWPCHTYLSCWKLKCCISAVCTHVCGTCFDLSTLSWPTMCFPWNVNFDLWELCRDGRHKHSLSNSVWLYNCFHHCFFKGSVFHKSLHLRRLFDQLIVQLLTQLLLRARFEESCQEKDFPRWTLTFFLRKHFLWEHLRVHSCQQEIPSRNNCCPAIISGVTTVLVKQLTIAGQEYLQAKTPQKL